MIPKAVPSPHGEDVDLRGELKDVAVVLCRDPNAVELFLTNRTEKERETNIRSMWPTYKRFCDLGGGYPYHPHGDDFSVESVKSSGARELAYRICCLKSFQDLFFGDGRIIQRSVEDIFPLYKIFQNKYSS